MNKMLSLWQIPVIVLLSSAVQSLSIADTVDVFPLQKGLQYSYLYEDSIDGSNYGAYIYKESGTITYTVLDSISMADTVILWTVRQNRDLVIQRYYPVPASYTQVDSTTGYVYESLAGNHSLSSSFRLWKFPRTTYYPELTIDSVFRYQDSSSFLHVHYYGCFYEPYPPPFDSIWFDADSGLHRRHWLECFGGEWGEQHYGSAELISMVIVSVHELPPVPTSIRLLPAYPNPFNGTTNIIYELTSSTRLTLRVFDINGRIVSILEEGSKSSGIHQSRFEAVGLSSGTYFIRLETPQGSQTQRLLYLR